jgi:transcription elongation GreA/GreB family factor/transposase-like protein
MLIVAYFRLMNELKKIEIEGNRLKNQMLDLLLEDNCAVLKKIVNRCDRDLAGRIFDIFENLPYIEESHLEKFQEIVNARFENFQVSHEPAEENWEKSMEKLIVTREGFERKKAELEHMVKVEMVNLSRDLAAVSEASGDIRENVEYNALMEKQAILKLAISRLDEELKMADVLAVDKISTDSVGIGTKVMLENAEKKDSIQYTILGPWDADFEQQILSYRSPIAKAMLGKKKGDTVKLSIDDEEKDFVIKEISRYR